MVKILNFISFFILITMCVLALFTYHKDMDVNIPYIETIFIVLSSIMALLLFFKLNLRWQALFIGVNQKGYPISKLGFINTITYESINLIFYLLSGIIFALYINEVWFLGAIILLYFLEGLFYLLANVFYKPYKIIFNSNNITIITNSINIIKLKNINKIEARHSDIQFIDKHNNVSYLDLDLISKEDAVSLKKEIKKTADKKEIYCNMSITI